MSERLQEFQEGLLWRVEEEEGFVVGFTQSALDLVGSVQAVELAEAGDEFEAGDWIGELRGKESKVEIVAPFSLRVSEHNSEILEQPALLEDDPTGDAWVIRVERLDG